ncbi:hypothetical protein Micbo1qcDRAFT_236782 [Microdochium bolleyi]|uniref:Zn(2)-C6 fungal-type domain-containing protein n=1 Tax=Microdochium bolleyi TaxID=196109 RepID=A0A136IP47_9PEZI|nr:hypothetical protein Micbo1qcDRAFT_236782 [Microdochium bolleyi]
MDVFRATPNPAPQKRTSKPKVRTGCARCKQRHIKCDEARPSCSACTRSSAGCQYIVLERKKQAKRVKPASKVQRSALAVLQPARREHVSLVSVPRGVDFGPRTTAIEAAYFQQYQVISNLELAHPDLWNRAMLRESVHDDCIRHGLMAIGALSKALYGNPDPAVRRLSLDAPGLRDNTHYQAAGSYYSTALRLLRARLARDGGTQNPRTILMATFMFIGYENMLDNFASVDILLANGIYLLRNQLAIFNHNGSRIAANVDDDGMAVAEYLLPRLAIMSSSSVPLYPSMKRVPFPNAATPPPMDIPQTSKSMRALRIVWDRSSTYYALWMFRYVQAMAAGAPVSPGRFRDQQRAILAHLYHWEATMKRILAVETDTAKKRSLMLSLVGIKAMCGLILCFADPTLMAWDAHTPLFSETLDYVEAAMAIQRPTTGANEEHIFDDSIIPAVDSLSLWCRDRELRRRTQALRERLARAWHTWGPMPKEKTARVGIQVVVAVEERFRDGATGLIPMESRHSWTGAAWDDDRTELLITMTGTTTTTTPGRSGGGTKVERTVAYSPLTKMITARSGWPEPFSCTFMTGNERIVQLRHQNAPHRHE